MNTIRIIIEKTADYYDAYAENCEGVYGAGETAEEAKADVIKALHLFVESRSAADLPKVLQGEYELVFKYDVQSILDYYSKIFTKPALEHMTGINQKLLHHYSSGLKKPRPAQQKKIETALHRLGKELLAIEL